MASSRKSKSTDPVVNGAGGPEAALEAALRPFLFPRAHLVLGLSGGIDSVVLFDLLRRAAATHDFYFSCVHVNHGISPNARRWSAFCARLCKRHGVELAQHTVDIAPWSELGVEAAARRARYEVFALEPADFIVLAQHQDDQVETLLLQLLRGAGVKGGAAMPVVRDLPESRTGRGRTVKSRTAKKSQGGAAILRPLLGVTRRQIEAYANLRSLKWIEDESNADIRYDRNFLRLKVLPVLERSFPAYRTTLARSAGHMAEANAILEDLAGADAMQVMCEGRMDVDGLRRLGAARTRNVLRWLLLQQGEPMPEAGHLEEAVRQLFEAGKDAAVHVAIGRRELRRFAGQAWLVHALPVPPPAFDRAWNGQMAWPLPELGGVLHFERRRGEGLSPSRVRAEGLSARLRQGGERLRVEAGRPTRSLKNLLQEARMPPWERERLPLLYFGGQLACVPGVGVADDCRARPGESGWFVAWRGFT